MTRTKNTSNLLNSREISPLKLTCCYYNMIQFKKLIFLKIKPTIQILAMKHSNNKRIIRLNYDNIYFKGK